VLPARNRVRRSREFSDVVRSGRRAGGRHVVVHHHPGPDAGPPRVGFVVSKAVGGSVVRHRVVRRLRAQMWCRLAALPAGSATVVRALPAAAHASSAELGQDLDRAFARLARGVRR